MDTASNTANAFATGNIVVNVLLGASLKLLWGLINTFQFIVFFTEWKVQIPANSLMALDTLRTIALGEFIPTEWLTEPLAETFLEGQDESVNNSKDRSSVFYNMGTMLLILIVIIAIILLLVACKCLCKSGSKPHKLLIWIRKKVFWNSVLRFVL